MQNYIFPHGIAEIRSILFKTSPSPGTLTMKRTRFWHNATSSCKQQFAKRATNVPATTLWALKEVFCAKMFGGKKSFRTFASLFQANQKHGGYSSVG
jgi:hypothetical protein